ncbi:biopolymer transporter ExbD [Motiliproteus sp. SC1-56]|uniref:ExbD/TolR family protein n=1 Tax=Motiliproteus sp. SC1-56 TaxID=2799565 RepID=UPI001A8F223A|nr:biopolymer transporter ExbD [Motiliproteus sp. SC1-56]
MKQPSHRTRRLQRARKRKPPMLNLVSLMDIFTILVFFLLVNSSDVQQPQGQALKLPEASVETPLDETLVVQVDGRSIVVQGRKVTDLDTDPGGDRIPSLEAELRYQAERNPEQEPGARAITLMADRDIPFALLQRIMSSANQAGFGQISLAVVGKAGEKPAS